MLLDLKEVKTGKAAGCKGKIYRCKINNFINAKGEIVESTRFVPVKKLSCPGCKWCCFIDEDIQEMMNSGNGLIIDSDTVHNALYEIVYCNQSTDWETGIVDDWDLKLMKIED